MFYSYFILAALLKQGVVDVSMLGSYDLLRMRSDQIACSAGDVLIVDERMPSATRMGEMVWVRDYVVECSLFRDKYIRAPKEIVELLGDK